MLNSNQKTKILFKMTGSIACYKACNILSKLVQENYDVQVVTSASALQFVGIATLEGLTGKPVLTDLWSPGNIMDHIHLMRWADLVIVAPASSNYINKVAHGVGDDLLTTLFLAHDFSKPYLVAPAMNTSMYLHPATQKSIQTLRTYGLNILETASGVLACGEVGYGKLLDPELIVAEIRQALNTKTAPDSRPISAKSSIQVLITAGGTQEPIDQVRVITNKSTGRTGARIADTLIEMGIDVTFLHAESSQLPKASCEKVSFDSFRKLETSLKDVLSQKNYDFVIHLAAVSDYSVIQDQPTGKLSSEADTLTLKLKKNPKLVNQIREYSRNKKVQLVAFKMTATQDRSSQSAAVTKLFTDSHADLVIQNDVSKISADNGAHSFHWCEPKQDFAKAHKLENANQLALSLAEWILAQTNLETP